MHSQTKPILTSPVQVRGILTSIGLKPSKVLGQNFLIDRNILEIILNAAELKPSDHVFEVGPGLGVLTAGLLEKAGKVTAIEKDIKLFSWLSERFAGVKNLELVHGDALDPALMPKRASKMVSNLPYSVASRILVELSLSAGAPELMVVTVQREVAERLAAEQGTADYGLLSVLIRLEYDITLVKKISPSCFWPSPDIFSQVVKLVKHGRFLLSAEEKKICVNTAKLAFTHRRKQFASVLEKKAGVGRKTVVALLESMGLSAEARAEELSPANWYTLAKALTSL